MKTTLKQRIIIILNIIAIFAVFNALPVIEQVNIDKELFLIAWFIFFLLSVNTYFK